MITRPVSIDADYVAAASVATAAAPDYAESPVVLRQRDESVRASGGSQNRWLVEDGSGPIATAVLGHFTWCTDPTIQGVGIRVIPQRQAEGVGRRLHESVLKNAAASGARLLVGFVDDRQERGREFAEAAGYQTVGHGFESHIDPRSAGVDRFDTTLAAVGSAGIRIDSLAALQQRTPDWLDRAAELYAKIEEDVPASVPTAPPDKGVFVAEVIESTTAIPKAFFIARDGDRWIGLTEIRRSDAAGHYDQELTGVLREYRRRGIATALKVAGLIWARDAGASQLRTWNDSRNAGMLAVNDLLGMHRSHSILEYHRAVGRVASTR